MTLYLFAFGFLMCIEGSFLMRKLEQMKFIWILVLTQVEDALEKQTKFHCLYIK